MVPGYPHATHMVPMLGCIILVKTGQPTMIGPDPKNVCSIIEMSTAQLKAEILRFLGAVGFLRDFIPNLTEL